MGYINRLLALLASGWVRSVEVRADEIDGNGKGEKGRLFSLWLSPQSPEAALSPA